jgi:adenosine kinase
MPIVVTGSVAFDHIMDFPGSFKDHILPEKVHVLSVSFLVESLKKQHGGAAANIAYNLALLGERPVVLAAVGEDFGDYRDFMQAAGIDTSALHVVDGELTASAFITTDRDDNQITGFYPGAMRAAGQLSLDGLRDVDLAVVSPDAPDAMARYPGECRERAIPYVYLPGQQIVSLSPGQLLDGIRGAACVIGNDYEMELLASKTESSPDDLLAMTGVVVTTLGELGSRITTRDREVEIPAAPARRVVDPTGAGDAYAAGVSLGLLRGDPPERFGRIGALCAAYAVEQYGTQRHRFDPEQFAARYQEVFGDRIA